MGFLSFKLKDSFIDKYKDMRPNFGFNGLGELTYMRTYSRVKEDGTNEKWYETVRRVVEGCYTIQKNHIKENGLGWSEYKSQKSAEEMYDRIFTMKFLPPGRGLWAMGTSLIHEKGLFEALNNCAFVSTESIGETIDEATKPFEFLMDVSMLGVGVGFDVKGEGKITIQNPTQTINYQIPDTREGWVISVKMLLQSYFSKTYPKPIFDYSIIRPAGQPIKTFGGLASGPDPLILLHQRIDELFINRAGQKITQTDIVDIMNMIGCAVVAGNVRRTAEIVFGDAQSDEYLSLKDYHWNGDEIIGKSAHRAAWGWTSNNSVFAKIGQNYKKVGNQTALNGEPGYAWLENMQKYGRMNTEAFDKLKLNADIKAKGGNPCIVGSTKLLTNKGFISIKHLTGIYKKNPDIRIITQNKDYQLESSKLTWCGITEKQDNIYRIDFSNGTFQLTNLKHKFYLESFEEISVKELIERSNEDILVRGFNCLVKILKITDLQFKEDVYDLTADPNFNFFAKYDCDETYSEERIKINNITFYPFDIVTTSNRGNIFIKDLQKDDICIFS